MLNIINTSGKIRLQWTADIFNFGITGSRPFLIIFYVQKSPQPEPRLCCHGYQQGVATGPSDRSCASRVLDPPRLCFFPYNFFYFLLQALTARIFFINFYQHSVFFFCLFKHHDQVGSSCIIIFTLRRKYFKVRILLREFM